MNQEQKQKISDAAKRWWEEHSDYRGSNFGKKISEETKEKMRQSKLGKKRQFTEEHKEKLRKILKENRYKGKPPRFCIDCGTKMNKSNKNKRCAECNRKYKRQYRINNSLNKSKDYHIIRGSKEFRDWRNGVFIRDNHTCQKCKVKGYELHPHHILNFNDHIDLRFDISNGITLCVEHHKEFHKLYGQKNNTREQIEEYIKTV